MNIAKQSLKIILDWKADEHPFNRIMFHFSHEYISSMAFLDSYKNVLINSLKRAESIVVYNDYARDLLNGLNANVMVIPSGVDTEKFVPSARSEKGGIKKILMAGRVAEYAKGLPVLENAFKLLLSKRDDIMLVLTVDDYFRPYENRFQGSHFRLARWVNQRELPMLYQDSDVVVVPSLWMEPFGIVAAEAMSCGVPVIASAVGGLKNIVVDGETGFLVKPGDERKLMNKLENLLDNDQLRSQMGLKGRERALMFYSWDRILDSYYVPLFSKVA